MAGTADPAAASAAAPNATAGGGGASGATGGSRTSRSGAGSTAGTPHRKDAARGPRPPAAGALAVARGVARGFGVGLGPLVATRTPWPVNVTSTDPSPSVRYVARATASSRASVSGVGWPYGLPAPAETTATRGRTADRNASVEAVLEPWWATFSRSTVGSPRATSSGSTPSSASPISRNRCGPTSPSSTIETLLIDVPPSGGCSGTRFGSGHRTRNRIESTVSRSPVDSRPRGGPPSPRT